MARYKVLILLILLGVVSTALLVWRLMPTEPSYLGKPLTHWLEQLQIGQYYDPKVKDEAVKALRAMGASAIPPLIKLLKKRDSALKQRINSLTTRSPLKRALLPEAHFDKNWAADALGEIGPPASAAIPALVLAS